LFIFFLRLTTDCDTLTDLLLWIN